MRQKSRKENKRKIKKKKKKKREREDKKNLLKKQDNKPFHLNIYLISAQKVVLYYI